MPSLARSFWVAGTGPMPMTRGGTPAETVARMRARGVRPLALAAASEAMIMAQAPSLMPDELPAVTEPPSRNAAGSLARISIVVSPRGCSSFSTMVSVLPFLTQTLTISLVEEAAILRRLAAALAAIGEGVLVGAADLVLAGDVLGGLAHGVDAVGRLHAAD